jgi:hypothetical protein
MVEAKQSWWRLGFWRDHAEWNLVSNEGVTGRKIMNR